MAVESLAETADMCKTFSSLKIDPNRDYTKLLPNTDDPSQQNQANKLTVFHHGVPNSRYHPYANSTECNSKFAINSSLKSDNICQNSPSKTSDISLFTAYLPSNNVDMVRCKCKTDSPLHLSRKRLSTNEQQSPMQRTLKCETNKEFKNVNAVHSNVFGKKSESTLWDFRSVAKSLNELLKYESKGESYNFSETRPVRKKSNSESQVYDTHHQNSSHSELVGGNELKRSCSQQARIDSMDDISIDELASYFEDFVHIPKRMSEMAEMMYT